MADAPSLRASEAAKLLTTFTDFLTIAIHSLLFHRGLYPAPTFLTARAFNLPVHQSRYPRLCNWINDAVAAVAAQLQSARVRRVALVVHAPTSLDVLERWIFDVSSFPDWGPRIEDDVVGDVDEDGDAAAPLDDDPNAIVVELEDELNWTDVNECLRGALSRIAYAAEGMPDVPLNSTFTLAVELRDDAPAPIGHPQPWIPSQAELQPPSASRPRQGSSLGGASTVPVRSVRAGPLFFECWVEKADAPSSRQESKQPSKSSAESNPS